MASDSPVMPGQILAGKYRIERLLGEGGHGVVVSAWHVALNERVAIKLLRPEVAQDTETVARFLREARASVRIKGEHVTRVLDVGSAANGAMPYMVMEHLIGSDLSSIVEAKGWLPVSLAVDYVLQTCEALAEAHGLGIVHRDIKPSNLFLTTRTDGSPCVKVLDFGISKAMAGATVDGGNTPDMNLTQTQTVLGSPQYMAPEQMRSSRQVDGRTDIWAIGTTLHELLTGKAPFEAKTMPELFAMILQDPAPRLADRRPEMPPGLELVVAKCLEKEPAKRWSDVHELARALAPFASSTGQAVVERIGRVGFNASKSNERLLPFDAGSAPGMDLTRTDRMTTTFPRASSPFLFAALSAFGLVVVSAAAFFAVQRFRAPPAATTIVATPAQPPSAADPLPSTVILPAAVGEETPPAPEATSVTTTTTATTLKRPGKPPRTAPSHKENTPASSAPVAPTPPPPTASTPPRTPGVASSRYD